jgi:DNA-binding NtrC family response regulator
MNVLAITDDIEISHLLSELLLTHIGPHSHLESCVTGSSAMNQLASGRHDLIFMDTQTKDIDALLLLSRIVDLQPKAMTFVITGQQDHSLIRQALDSGAYDFLAKPIDYLAASLKLIAQNRRHLEDAQAKDELLAHMTHALRTPLNVILNWVQLMRMEKTESTRDLAIEVIERNVKELAALLTKFENLSRSHGNSLSTSADPAGRYST